MAYLLSIAFYTVVTRLSGDNFFHKESHLRWDAVHYLSISNSGYRQFLCTDVYPNFPDPEMECGTTGWFPLYPMLTRIVTSIGITYETAALIVTEAAFIGVLWVLWWLLEGKVSTRNVLILGIAALFPGSIFFHAAFPMTVGILGLLIAIIGLKKSSWLIAGAGGFIAASSHMMGVTIVGVLALSVFFAWQGLPWFSRVYRAAAATVLAFLGFAWMSWMMWKASGRWDMYFHTQSTAYGNGVNDPIEHFEKIWNRTVYLPLPAGSTELVMNSIHAPRHGLIASTILLLIILFFAGLRFYRERQLEVADWAVVILAVAIYVLPLVAGGNVTPYRNHAMMLPALILLRGAPRPVLVGLTGLVGWAGVTLGAAWTSGQLS